MNFYNNINEIERANGLAGYHFFEEGSKRFFRSRILSEVYGGRYFITSEQFVSSYREVAPRQYTIRRADGEGHVASVGAFNSYRSAAEARRVIMQLLEEEKKEGLAGE